MNRTLLSTIALAAATVLFFAVNVISGGLFGGARLDLTENRLHTLSEGTGKILGALDEPVVLRLFFSAKLANQAPQLRTYGLRVRDLLQEFANRSRGKLRLEVIDPEPFSNAEDRAVAFGLQGAALNAAGDNFYFGLAGTNSTDDTEVIPFFSPDKEQFLEYDLTKLVYALSNPKKPVVGVISSLPLEFGPGGMQMAMRGQSRPYGIMASMRQFFEVRSLDSELDEIDPEVDILLLAHARNLEERTLYAIDQYLLGGGRAMIFVDPFSETAAAMPPPPGQQPNPLDSHNSNLKKLFEAWGVALADDVIVADRGLATRVNAGGQARRQVIDYPAWISLRGEAIDREDVVTAELGTILMANAGHLVAADGASTTFTPLLRSSPDSMLVEVSEVRFRSDPEKLLAGFAADEQSYVVAARLTGAVKSAFEGPPATEEEAGDEGETATADRPHLAESTEPLNVIVVADADLLDDRFWLSRQSLLGQEFLVPTAANADFLINGLDNLAGSSDLISLRSRARSDRPFEVIENIRRDAEQRYLARQQELEQKLEETEKKLAELQSKASGGGGAILSAEEAQAIDSFRQDLLVTRKELRGVQHELRKDIEGLETWLKFLNIGLVPLAVFMAAIMLALVRHQRRKAGVGAGAGAALKQA
jgi:ABC-type uncharacterized transport system involved in gliding motility auxiliary subunit